MAQLRESGIENDYGHKNGTRDGYFELSVELIESPSLQFPNCVDTSPM
jgi:hypothetical protein